MSVVSTIKSTDKQIMKVYAARDYTPANPRLTDYVAVNVPEYIPTIPKDDKYEQIGLGSNFFANTNFPITVGNIKMTHYIELPLMRCTSCPIYFKKDTPFLLFLPTTKIEEGFLMYI